MHEALQVDSEPRKEPQTNTNSSFFNPREINCRAEIQLFLHPSKSQLARLPSAAPLGKLDKPTIPISILTRLLAGLVNSLPTRLSQMSTSGGTDVRQFASSASRGTVDARDLLRCFCTSQRPSDRPLRVSHNFFHCRQASARSIACDRNLKPYKELSFCAPR